MAKQLSDHNYNGIDATIIADSLNAASGDRITTFILTFPRIVLAEFNTHRQLSRNSSSSRAIPFRKTRRIVQENPFIPIGFQKDHKGMQGTEYFRGEELTRQEEIWLQARDEAVKYASYLNENGVTKQLCNRLLEPFMYQTVICTATEYENFFALRAEPSAEIHIAKLAEIMLDEYNASTPNKLLSGYWHIPFGELFDMERLVRSLKVGDEVMTSKIKVATARCARVSYLNFEGKDDYKADIRLHDRLAEMGHWSPFEHCARAMDFDELMNDVTHGWSGNFKGFSQYRKSFFNEVKSDPRVKRYNSRS